MDRTSETITSSTIAIIRRSKLRCVQESGYKHKQSEIKEDDESPAVYMTVLSEVTERSRTASAVRVELAELTRLTRLSTPIMQHSWFQNTYGI